MVYTGTRKHNLIILFVHTIIIFQNHLRREYPVIQLVIGVIQSCGSCVLISIMLLLLSPYNLMLRLFENEQHQTSVTYHFFFPLFFYNMCVYFHQIRHTPYKLYDTIDWESVSTSRKREKKWNYFPTFWQWKIILCLRCDFQHFFTLAMAVCGWFQFSLLVC